MVRLTWKPKYLFYLELIEFMYGEGCHHTVVVIKVLFIFVCVYVYIYVSYLYINTYIYIYKHNYMHTYIRIHTHIYIYTNKYIYIHTYMYTLIVISQPGGVLETLASNIDKINLILCIKNDKK
jgi:hypothetical protein